jgi:sodium-dependent dicarboxylate transporter 2/3/5
MEAKPDVEARVEAMEKSFDRVRRPLGLILAPVLFVGILLIKIPGLAGPANALAALMAAVAVLWVTEALPLAVTALIGPAVAVMLGLGSPRAIFAPFADPLIFLFIGSFILAEAIFAHRLNERIAYGVMSLSWVGPRPSRILLAYGVIGAGLSMWISNTATAAMLLPIGLSLLAFMEKNSDIRRSYGTALMLLTSYSATWGGVGTPVGTPPNLIGIGMIERYAGIRVDFLQWMMIGVPMAACMLTIVFLYLGRVGRPGVAAIAGSDELIRTRKANLGPWRRGEKNVMAAFIVTAALWLIPGLLPLVLGQEHGISRFVVAMVPESVAALLGAGLLFVLPLSSTSPSTITWKEASQIDWGTILLFGSGLALGELAFTTKLADALGHAITGVLPASSLVFLTFAAALFSIVLSEAMSNTAATNIAVPIVISIAMAAEVNPLAPALAATFAASAGFALPVSTPPNAIAYSSGRIPILRMVRYGILLDLVAVVVIPTLLLLLVPLVFG